MKTNRSTEALLIGLLLLPFVFLGLIWHQLPEQIPSHYGADGQINQYQPKLNLAIIMLASTVVQYGILRFLPRLDPRQNLKTPLYQKIRTLIIVFWSVFLTWFWYISWQGVQAQRLVNGLLVGVGLLLAGLGNLMNSVKPNYFVGIRTPWTLDSETVWRRTHHLAARLFTAGGLLLASLAWLVPNPAKLPLLVGLPVSLALVAVVYSYICFQQEKPHQVHE